MTIESTLAFTLAMLVLAAAPGPGVFASTAQALADGFGSSLHVIAGIVMGDLILLFFAILGLSAVATVFGELFFIVKIVGAGYLIWLGCKLWVREPTPLKEHSGDADKSAWKRFVSGLLITLGNPKAILFYCGFLPTFTDLGALTIIDVSIIGSVVGMVLASVMMLYAYCAARARRLLTSPRAARNFNRGAGTILIGTGAAIATR